MEYIYFQLDKNPRQVKKLSLSSIDIDMRIEWNTRSKCWYVLGYVGDDLVLRNTKVIPNQMYSFDLDSEYDIPYRFMITTEYKNYNWDTNTLFMLFEDNMNKIDEGLTEEGYLVDRRMGTTSDTHSKVKLKSEYNNYLFDVVKVSSEAGVTITCVGAVDSFSTIGLPQGRWDFSINGKRHVTADEAAMIEMLNEYGITITDIGDGEYSWSNTTDVEVKIEGYYPYAVGYPLTLNLESNETLRVLSKDDNNWVNRFTVCLSSFVDTVWEVYITDISDDYNNLVFRARKSLTGVKPTEEEALIEKYKSGLDSYSSSIVDTLTGVSDWILDPANNQIRYYEQGSGLYATHNGVKYTNLNDYCTARLANVDPNKFQHSYYKITSDSKYVQCYVIDKRSQPWNYDYFNSTGTLVQGEQEEKSIPLETVAQQVISNAANGDTNAQDLLNTLNKYDSYAEVEILPLIADQYKQGLDVYSSGVVDELTGVEDWVLDPENNQIKYYEPADPTQPSNTFPILYYSQGYEGYYGTLDAAINAAIERWNVKPNAWGVITGIRSVEKSSQTQYKVDVIYQNYPNWVSPIYITTTANPNYDPDAKGEEKYLPLDTVAQQVISNAEGGNVDAQQVALSAALSPTLVSSLSDSNMQQWQAVTDAIGQLTGVSSWTFDNAAKIISYTDLSSIPEVKRYKTNISGGPTGWYPTKEDACQAASSAVRTALGSGWAFSSIFVEGSSMYCNFSNNGSTASYNLIEDDNPDYDPNYTPPVVSITYQQVADKIIADSNAADQGISLLADVYIQEALLKFTDFNPLVPQFETNKQA